MKVDWSVWVFLAVLAAALAGTVLIEVATSRKPRPPGGGPETVPLTIQHNSHTYEVFVREDRYDSLFVLHSPECRCQQ